MHHLGRKAAEGLVRLLGLALRQDHHVNAPDAERLDDALRDGRIPLKGSVDFELDHPLLTRLSQKPRHGRPGQLKPVGDLHLRQFVEVEGLREVGEELDTLRLRLTEIAVWHDICISHQ